jgi:uncharacterized membrane protein YozB (DUF420 family)
MALYELKPEVVLPAFNAGLNSSCTLLLLAGYAAIRRRRIRLHTACMLAALAVSALFLASYLYYHFVIKHGAVTSFKGPEPVRTIYLAVLFTHTVLAALVAPMALVTAYLGLRNRLVKHVRLARITLPIWLYVSITGVLVYWILYHLYPAA